MNTASKLEPLSPVISAEQIQKRVREMGHQISDDYRGKTIHALAVLENSFIFMADLVRALEVPVACAFVKPSYRKQPASGPFDMLEILFSHELDFRGKEVLLVEGLVHSGVTSEFLTNDLRARGAATVKLATLLARQAARCRSVDALPPARPPVRAPGPVAARLFWLSGRRGIPGRLRVGKPRTHQ